VGVEPLKYQLAPKLAPAADSDEWLTVRMRYKHPDSEKLEAPVTKSLSGAAVKLTDTSLDFRFGSSVAAFGMLLRASPYRGEATFGRQAADALGNDPHRHRAEFLGLVEAAEKLRGR
jgi:Ca-activated chloride channel family protein